MLDFIKRKFLERSNSYNYYKSQTEFLSTDLIERVNKLNERTNKLSAENKTLTKELERVRNYNNRFCTSNHNLLKTLYMDYDLQPKGIFKNVRLLELELIQFVENICKKYDLEYWLDYGSLLGAARHGGFIPWDDDADVGMMRKDYEKFYKYLQIEIKNLNLNTVHFNRNMVRRKNIMLGFIQIYYAADKENMGNVDVFPYDFVNNGNLSSESYSEYRNKFYLKIFNKNEDNAKAFKSYLQDLNIKIDDGDYIIPGPGNFRANEELYPYVVLDKSDIFPIQNINFENFQFSCPNNVDKYLTAIYGDYMEIHKIIRKHAFIRKLRKNENIFKDYEIAFKRMREVNENFFK